MGIKIADLLVKIGADTSGVEKGLDSTSALIQKTGASMVKSGALLTAGLTTPVVLLGKSMLNSAMHAEQSKVAFTTMLKSGEAATKFLADLRDFAAKTPFEFTELEDASRRMLAFGFEASQVLPMMTSIGDATSGLGLGADGVNRVVLALGQMKAKAKLSAQEMMQLTETGIPAWKYLAESMGLTTAEVMKLSEKGLIPADQAIQSILEGMEVDFGGMMAEQMETAGGKASNFADSLERLKVNLGDEFLPLATTFIDKATILVEKFDQMGEGGKKAALGVAAGVALIGPVTTVLGVMLNTVGKIGGALVGLGSGIKAFGSGLSLTTSLGVAGLTPIAITLGAVALAVGSVVAVWMAWNKQIKETNEKGQESVRNAWADFFDNQVKSGKNAVQVLEEYEEKQAGVNQTLKDAGIIRWFIKDQEQLQHDTEGLNIAVAETSRNYGEYLEVLASSDEKFTVLSEAQWNLVHGGYAMISGFENGAAKLDLLTGSAETTKGKLGELVTQYDALQASMQDWLTNTASGLQTMLEKALPDAGDEFMKGLGALDEVFGTTLVKQQEMEDAQQALIDQYAKTGDLDAFKSGLMEIKDEGLKGMKEELENVVGKAEELYENLMLLPKEIQMAIDFDTSSIPDWVKQYLKSQGGHRNVGDTSGGTGEALGGPVWANQPYIVGERRSELFVPQQNGRIEPSVKSGAMRFNNYGTVVLGSEDPFSVELLAALS